MLISQALYYLLIGKLFEQLLHSQVLCVRVCFLLTKILITIILFHLTRRERNQIPLIFNRNYLTVQKCKGTFYSFEPDFWVSNCTFCIATRTRVEKERVGIYSSVDIQFNSLLAFYWKNVSLIFRPCCFLRIALPLNVTWKSYIVVIFV